MLDFALLKKGENRMFKEDNGTIFTFFYSF